MYLILQSILLLTPPVVGQRSVAISMPACPRAHLTNSMSNLHQSFFFTPMVMVRSSCGGVVIRYVLPVSWLTLGLHIMARNGQREKACTK